MVLRLLLSTLLLAMNLAALADDGGTHPDPELLEFLGRIAGLESMGVDIDTLLAESLEGNLQPEEEDNDEQS